MINTSRSEHIQWVRQRALEELDADPEGSGPLNALTSIMSDLRKHPDTQEHTGIELTMLLLLDGYLTRSSDVRKHIEGFQ